MSEQLTCVKRVYSNDRFPTPHRCSRKPGFGPGGQFCRQHGETEAVPDAPTVTWYRTRNWGFGIEEVQVISATEKTLLLKPENASKPSRQNIVSDYAHFWPKREEAVAYLRKRLEAKRSALARDEAEFKQTVGYQT